MAGWSTVRGSLAALFLTVPVGGATLAACSGSSSGGGGGDASADAPLQADCSSAGTSCSGTDTGAPGKDASGKDGSSSDAGSTADATDAAQGDVDATAPDAHDAASLFPSGGDCGVGPTGEPTELRCTGLYSDWDAKTVAQGNTTYDPGLHLWSDGADKTRWISLPPGTKIDTTDMDEWTFPVGTRIWKEFRLPLGDAGTETRIETRLLWKLSTTQWYRTTYRWSADGESSTVEEIDGELDAGGTGYEVPSVAECNDCHDGRLDGVLGFEAVALSSAGATPVTMQTLAADGLITAVPSSPIVIPGDAVESAALAYLHTNCGIACHNPNGAASFTQFYMRLDVGTLTSVQTTNAYTTGWGVMTTNFTIPGEPASYRIHACDLAESCAYYRPDHRDGLNGTQPGTQMPPIDTHVIDSTGVAAIAAWITQGCADAGGE
jgi:hypothetical protein